jgi:hypothetical protein
MHMDAKKDGPAIESIAETLTEKLYAHDYLITRDEAAAIGLNATHPSPAVEAAMWDLYKRYEADLEIGGEVNIPAVLGTNRQQYFCLDVAIIENVSSGHGFAQKGMLEKRGGDEFHFAQESGGWAAF